MSELSLHPPGAAATPPESRCRALVPAEGPVSLDTFGGRIHVEWDPSAAVTPLGQLPLFIEFLKVSGPFDVWVEDCPVRWTSNNAPNKPIYGHQEGACSATTRTSPGDPRTLTTPTSSPICAWCWTWRCSPATNTTPSSARRGCGICSSASAVRAGRGCCAATATGARRATCSAANRKGWTACSSSPRPKRTKALVERLLRDAEWTDAGQGWQGTEASLRLSGWSRERRVVVLRRRLKKDLLIEDRDDSGQLRLSFAEPDKHSESITSRPLLLNAPARRIDHARQRRLVISRHHAEADWVERVCRNLAAFLHGLRLTAEQLTPLGRWHRILSRAMQNYLDGRDLQPPAPQPTPP